MAGDIARFSRELGMEDAVVEGAEEPPGMGALFNGLPGATNRRKKRLRSAQIGVPRPGDSVFFPCRSLQQSKGWD